MTDNKPRNIYLEVLHIAYPLMISSGSFTLMNFCDRMFLSWFSEEALRAALPAGILAFAFQCGFHALVSYSNTFVAQYHGAGDRDNCSRATAQGVFFSFISWPILILLIPLGIFLLKISGHPAEIFALEKPYFSILIGGAGFTLTGIALTSFYTGRGKTLITMMVQLVCNLTNILLNYLLIFGVGIFPEMGIVGAAVATVASSALGPVLLLFLYFSRINRKHYRTWETFRPHWPLIKRMIRFASPSAIHFALDLGSFSLFVLLVGRLSAGEHIAANIALSVNLVAFMPMIGMGIAASTMVGQYQGKQDSDMAQKAGWAAAKMGLLYVILITSTFAFMPGAYIDLFTEHGPRQFEHPNVFSYTRILLLIMIIWGVFDAFSLILSGALKGAGDTRFVMICSLAIAWLIFVPGMLILVLWLKKGVIWAWGWTAFYIGLLASIYTWRWISGHWKQINVLGQEPVKTLPTAESSAIHITE